MKKHSRVFMTLFAMVFALACMSAVAFADDVAKAKVSVSVQSELQFSVVDMEVEATSDLSDQYGYEDAVDASKVSALDALIAAHVAVYGMDQAKVNEALTMSGGNPGKMMGITNGYSGFVLNDGYPKDPSTGYGYNANQAEVQDGDVLSFFWYEDDAYTDTHTVFKKDGEIVRTVNAVPGEEITLQLTGFMVMAGYQDDSLKPIEGAAICTLDEERNANPLLNANEEPILTDENGNVTLNLEVGTYYLTAIEGDADVRVIMPSCKIVVAPKALGEVTLAKTAYTYNKKAQKPAVTVLNENDEKLVEGTDYTVAYKNNTKVGKATVTVTGKGVYEGTVSKTFTINPVATSLKSLKKGKKAFTAKWAKKTDQVTGYQIQYATSKKFSKAKTVTVKKAKTTSKTVKKLKAKKTYYVKVRTYKTVSGKKYYSAWSKVKSVKTK